MNTIELRPALKSLSFSIGAVALVFTIVTIVARIIGMFGPGNPRWLLMLTFCAMIALPWLVLGAHGRRQIGLKLPIRAGDIALGAAVGMLASAICFALGVALYGASIDNWFVSIANSYRLQPTAGWSLLQLHLVFTTIACLFSPLGEEIFFRGFLQKVLEQRFYPRAATAIEAGLFALVHLCHHGVIAGAAGLVLLPGSGALWVLLMFALSLALAWLRKRSDSLLPPIAAHAAFNAMMNTLIFAYLWN